MARNVQTRSTSFLPGAGRNSAGDPKQGKTRVTGVINVTSYAKGNESLAAVDVGMTAIDAISLRVADSCGDPSGGHSREVRYDKSVGTFYLMNISESGVSTEYADTATETVEFIAEGDSAHDVELV